MKKWFYLSFFILLIFGCAVLGWQIKKYPTTKHEPFNHLVSGPTLVSVNINKGMTFSAVTRALEHHHLIYHPLWFRIYGYYRDVEHSIKPGVYKLADNLTPKEILDTLIAGSPLNQIRVLFPEGKNLLEVQQILVHHELCTEVEAKQWLKDKLFIQNLQVPPTMINGVEVYSLEGYLFPNTYDFALGKTTCKQAIEKLVTTTLKVIQKLKEDYPRQFRELKQKYKFNDHEILTFASLIEKETGQADERPMIAQVFFNRLKPEFSSHRLETDPTISYGCTVPEKKSKACESFKGTIKTVHLNDVENPYNTYTHTGLPPGPICNPGKASIEAVLKPTPSAYLFFVAKGGGRHYFSRTQAEHQDAVNRFIRHLPAAAQ